MIWRRDFPFSDETYSSLEIELATIYELMCEAHVLISAMSMTQWTDYQINHLVTQSWLQAFHGD